MRYITAILIAIIAIFSIVFYDTIGRLLWIGGFTVIVSAFMSAVGYTVYLILIAREHILTARLNRKRAQYVDFTDGFGMLHLLNLLTDRVENLSTYPGSHHNGTWQDPPPAAAAAWFALVGKARAESPVGFLPGNVEPPAIELLPLLDRAERVLVKGASDAGKTTLFQHIATRSQNVIIVDPHFKPGLWPANAKIIGAGRNFGEIVSLLDWLIRELDSRYKQRAGGSEDWIHYTVLIDEFMSINEACDNAGKVLSAMIRESRKVGFRLFVGSHSELVRPMGIEGASDIKEGLLIVRLEYDQVTGERGATVDYGRGKRPCQFPPFYGPQIGLGEASVVLPDLVLGPKVTTREAQIIELIQEGAGNKRIAQEVFGKPGLSGDNFYTVKAIRDRLILEAVDQF